MLELIFSFTLTTNYSFITLVFDSKCVLIASLSLRYIIKPSSYTIIMVTKLLADVTNSSPQMLHKGKTKIDLPYKYCLIHIFCLSYLGYYIQPGSKFMCFSSSNTFPNIDSLPCSLFSPAFGNLRTYISNLPIFCFHFLISLYYLLSNCHI